MTTTFSPAARRRATSAGPSSGTTCLASASMSFSVFIGSISILPPFPVGSRVMRRPGPSSRPYAAAILTEFHDEFHQGHHPRGRIGNATVPPDPRGEQAARPDLQQADDLLPAIYPDAVGHHEGSGHHDAPGSGSLP